MSDFFSPLLLYSLAAGPRIVLSRALVIAVISIVDFPLLGLIYIPIAVVIAPGALLGFLFFEPAVHDARI